MRDKKESFKSEKIKVVYFYEQYAELDVKDCIDRFLNITPSTSENRNRVSVPVSELDESK